MKENHPDICEYKLAIIIPAFRKKFFKETLDSLCGQTDQRFRVYVGDDASPDDLKQICEDYRNRFNIYYLRFSDNLGKTSLVQHWNRCVRLSNEPWCCLFCDDDIMDPRCVENFYRTTEDCEKSFPVYRFNTSIIDAEGNILKINPDHPEIESGIEFAFSRFDRRRASFVSEYIFSRQAFDAEGGFVDFPLAWCSDDASWIAFSGSQGIFTINGPRVFWRYSGFNISSLGNKYQIEKIEASIEYIRWFENRIIQKNIILSDQEHIDILEKKKHEWLYHQLLLVSPLNIVNYFKVLLLVKKYTKNHIYRQFLDLFLVEIKSYKPFIRSLFAILKRILYGIH